MKSVDKYCLEGYFVVNNYCKRDKSWFWERLEVGVFCFYFGLGVFLGEFVLVQERILVFYDLYLVLGKGNFLFRLVFVRLFFSVLMNCVEEEVE